MALESALEFKYLVELTKDYVQECQDSRQPPTALNWPRFIRFCTEHNVAGTLLPLIPRDDLSPEVTSQVDEAQRLSTESAIFHLLYLERILPKLEAAHCQPIVLKGGVLAPLLYYKPEHRFMSDLDILVAPDQVTKACAVLKGLGLKHTRTAADPEYYRNHHFHWIMNSDSGFVLEVHWGLALPNSVFQFDMEGLRARSVTSPLNNTTMRVLSPVDHLLHIVIQCSAGDFSEMRRVIDAGLLFRTIKDTETLVSRAYEQNQSTALWLLLSQVDRWTGIAVSQALLNQLAPSKERADQLSELTERLLRGETEFRHYGEINHLLGWLCAPSALLQKQEFRNFIIPGASDWLELGFPPQAPPGLRTRIRIQLSRLSTLFYLVGVTVSLSLFRRYT